MKEQIKRALFLFNENETSNFQKKRYWLDLNYDLHYKSSIVFNDTCSICFEINSMESYCNCKLNNLDITRKDLKGFIELYEEINKDFNCEFRLPKGERFQTPYEASFLKDDSILRDLKDGFYRQKKSEVTEDWISLCTTYSNWMYYLKHNIDFIEPYKLKYFYDLYKDNPIFSCYFVYTEEEMFQYKSELVELFDYELYKIELERQHEMIKAYLFVIDNNLFTYIMDRYIKNPFAFLKNFYSNNYRNADKNTGEYLTPTFLEYVPKFRGGSYFNRKFDSKSSKDSLQVLNRSIHCGFKKRYSNSEKIIIRFLTEGTSNYQSRDCFQFDNKILKIENNKYYQIENCERIRYEVQQGIIDYAPSTIISEITYDDFYFQYLKLRGNELSNLVQLLYIN